MKSIKKCGASYMISVSKFGVLKITDESDYLSSEITEETIEVLDGS